jgi:hypothetical protein
MGDWCSEENTDTLHQEITAKAMMLALATLVVTGRYLSLPRQSFLLLTGAF